MTGHFVWVHVFAHISTKSSGMSRVGLPRRIPVSFQLKHLAGEKQCFFSWQSPLSNQTTQGRTTIEKYRTHELLARLRAVVLICLVTCWHQLWVEHLRVYLSSIKGRVFRLYTLRLGDEGEDHLRLQAQGQLLVVLLLGTVAWSLAVFILCKQVCVSLHQKLRQGKARKGEI